MQPEWIETFLRPFTIMYSALLVFFMDFALIESRFSKRVYFAASAFCMVLCCAGMIQLYRVGGLSMMQDDSFFATTLPSGVVFYFLSKHKGSRFFLAFCTADMAGMAMFMLSMSLSIFLGGGALAILITRMVLLTLMTVFVVKWAAKPFCHILNTVQKGWGAAAFVALLFYLLLYGYFLFPTTIERRPEAVSVGILILVLLFSVYWFIYKTIFGLDKIHLAEKTEQSLRLLLELQKEQYDTIEEKIKADQIFRHDLRHHTNLLAAMLNERNIEEALSYIQKLKHYDLEQAAENYCENAVVNAVLSSHLGTAARRGICVSCRAELPQTAGIDEMELCVLLSNLLENAIQHCHAACGGGVPTLEVSVKKNKGQVCIRIRNTFDDRVVQDENGVYLSAKPQGGIGLKSVSAIVEKHHGVLNITHMDGMFTVDVAL